MDITNLNHFYKQTLISGKYKLRHFDIFGVVVLWVFNSLWTISCPHPLGKERLFDPFWATIFEHIFGQVTDIVFYTWEMENSGLIFNW